MQSWLVICFILSVINPSRQQHTSEKSAKSLKCGRVEGGSKYSASANQWSSYLDHMEAAAKEVVECVEDEAGCSTCHYGVIKQDLSPFESGITRSDLNAAANISSVTKYQLINHELFRSEFCMFPFRCRGIEHFLLELLPELPDTEFYLNTRDWPMAGKYFGPPVPLLSFSKTRDFWDIMYPAWTFWEGGPALGIYPNGLGRWDNHIVSLGKAADENPWVNKALKGFFRGSRTSAERDPLILLSRECPDLVDAQYTKNQAWKSDKDTLGYPPAAEVSLEEHCRFKYLFNYRGVAASFRFKHLFLCKSLVLHIGDEWLEFFYPALQPWFHYIPVDPRADRDQLQSILEFAQHHDAKMREIAENGAKFIEKHLKMADISCYWRELLLQYTALLKMDIIKDEKLINII